ncbi:MAG: serine/threonine-protein kinase [Isosphaeraceae bacterium]|nr:serine/threonine-protein kinase [Isosphaeraceae bacterium]
MARFEGSESSIGESDGLEGTMVFDPPGSGPRSKADLGFDRADRRGRSLSLQTNDLRRERLGHICVVLTLIYATLFLWNLMTLEHSLQLVWATMALRLAFVVLLGLMLISPVPLTPKHVKWVELLLFGGLTLILSASQYVASRRLLLLSDEVMLVAFEKNGVLQMFTLMLLHGALVPNRPRQAAAVIVPMALLPAAALVMVMVSPECEEFYDSLKTTEQIGSNILFLVIGAGVSIYSAWMVNRLRRELHEAKKLGRYRLGAKIGSGGMGEVYLAEHEFLKRPCALKLIRSDVLDNPVAKARFELEVQSAARLSHPNTIEIYDYGHDDDGTFYYVMEYLKGMTLGQLVTRFGPMPAGRVIYLFRQICAGLAEAHAMGLIHRDLKPANIFVAVRGGETDVAKVLDFGLVKDSRSAIGPQLTADQSVSGTPQFMAPEQATGKRDLDARVDIYALGCVMYYSLSGRPPFNQSSAFEVMVAHVRDVVEPLSSRCPEIPADLEAAVMRCLSKAPDDRFLDVKALGRALAACSSAAEWDADAADRWWAGAAKSMRSSLVSDSSMPTI